MTSRSIRAAILATALAACGAEAQLKQSQVLVVYDSRIADSREVAAYYAGSFQVPGATPNFPGVRPGVRVFDLAQTPGTVPAVMSPGDITFAEYVARLRTPLRTFLQARGLQREIRCIVLTKGLPHRITDHDNPAAKDQPATQQSEFNSGDATSASVDSELTLLLQNYETGELGNRGDSRLDGVIINPFWRSTVGINHYPTDNIATARNLTRPSGGTNGQVWGTTSSLTNPLTAGEMYLVCRLDARTLADVKAIIDRAANIYLDVNNAAFVFDEISSNTVADTAPSAAEYDNQALGSSLCYSGDDYEKTRDYMLNTDRRFAPSGIFYNAFGGSAIHFIVGPRIAYSPAGTVVNRPVALLASVGSNCGAQSTQPLVGGINAGQNYADSFVYANGALFNSIESYNGRDFGGIGGWTGGWGPQEQAADFLAAGGTFAIVNVEEPFTFPLPDNEWLVKNFYLGNMTYAEAAYSSLPCLSWQQIVVGDPLARVVRSSEDINADGKVDIEDLYAWEQGPVDIDRSGAADDTDRQMLTAAIRRAE